MTMPTPESPVSLREDEYQLRLLSIFYFILAGLTALIGCFPLIHVAFGFVMIIAGAAANAHPAGPAPLLGGMLFMLIGGAIFIICQAIAFCTFLAGRFLRSHQQHTYCLVIAVIICFSFPVGTVLGVFTILVLVRPEVRRLFGAD
ncbi:hypothetical protein DTL42_11445 [Bremerella cremea]|uniref:Uncharacterized protein n=1 Tax=Bremerella cremea TaxID=1031537 RepID=A0A368KSR4_9BACT|nr:hypothetical protein [Bremerella cremea]RCS49150.1 hypothetical protein DTL42_11445 [Bremerella cremea]